VLIAQVTKIGFFHNVMEYFPIQKVRPQHLPFIRKVRRNFFQEKRGKYPIFSWARPAIGRRGRG